MSQLSQETKDLLIRLADQYEKKEFIKDDPIRFPNEVANRGGNIRDVEISAILSSWMAYGKREQFCMALDALHGIMNYKPYDYLVGLSWERYKDCHDTLYRFFSYHDFYLLMDRIVDLYDWDALEIDDDDPLHYLIFCFRELNGFPKDSTSACKRLNMLLRWMVRKDSPVDLGLWNIDPAKLIIPVDTHVHRMALKLGLTKRKQADMRTALEITDAMREIWPEDPAKGDFALFGYGVNHKNRQEDGIKRIIR